MSPREVLLFPRRSELGAEGTFIELERSPDTIVLSDGVTYKLAITDSIRSGSIETLERCILCGHEDFYIASDFPRALGILIISAAAVTMFFIDGPFFFAPLILASIVDFVLYQLVPRSLHCYVCSSVYRGFKTRQGQAPYDLETATHMQRERWRLNGANATSSASLDLKSAGPSINVIENGTQNGVKEASP